MALVFEVILSAIKDGLMVQVVSSISTKTGIAPAKEIAERVGTQVLATVITSSPYSIPQATKAKCKASVPEPTPTPYLALQYSAKFFSKHCT